MTAPATGRRAEIAENLTALRARIAAACQRARRDVGEITVIPVTKTRPPSDVTLLPELPLTHTAEDRAPQTPPRGAFGKLAEVGAGVRAGPPDATMISAGMSGDLEEAIEAGAAHVRVGTALLGARRVFVR